MNILDKIRNLPESRRKIIFWSVMIIIGAGAIIVYFINIQINIRNFKSIDLKEKLKMPSFGEELKDFPNLEMPELSEEELRQMEEDLKKLEEENQTTTDEETKATTTE